MFPRPLVVLALLFVSPLGAQWAMGSLSPILERPSRLESFTGNRFSLVNQFYSSYLTGVDGTGSFVGGYLATLGYQFSPEWKADLTLGYTLANWSTGREWQFGQSLSLSNIKGASVEWRGKNGVSLRFQVGQGPDDVTGFGSRFSQDLFGRSGDSLSGLLSMPANGEKARIAVSVSTAPTKP